MALSGAGSLLFCSVRMQVVLICGCRAPLEGLHFDDDIMFIEDAGRWLPMVLPIVKLTSLLQLMYIISAWLSDVHKSEGAFE